MTARRRPVPWQQKPLFAGSTDDLPRSGDPKPRTQYGRVPTWFLQLQPTAAALRFYTYAACTLAGRDGYFWHADPVLAERTGQSVRTVQRAIRELVRLGALTVQPRWSEKTGRQMTNLYQLQFRAPVVTGGVTELSQPGVKVVTGPPEKPASPQLQTPERNQTQVTTPTKTNASPSLKKSPSVKRQSVPHHHQRRAHVDDDGQPFDKNEQLDTCQGSDVEAEAHTHSTPKATARHLELFLGHGAAMKLVQECGVEAVNQALVELQTQKGLSSRAGWITVRARDLGKGAAPMQAKARQAEDYSWGPREQWNFHFNEWVWDYMEKHQCDRSAAVDFLREYHRDHDYDPWEEDDEQPRPRVPALPSAGDTR